MVCRAQYYEHDSVNGNILKREAYKTSLHNYSSSDNFGSCSANFEFSIKSKDTNGQQILFKAMNSTAALYKWTITGFGVPITSNNDTISTFFPYSFNDIWNVGLVIEGVDGCRDTLNQNILVRDYIQTIASVNQPDNKNSYFKSSPNPASTQITIINSETSTDLSIINCLGQTLVTIPIKQKETEVNISNLPNGIYFLRTSTGQTSKIIIQH